MIDVAAEVFEVDAAGSDDTLLLRYSGIVLVLNYVIGLAFGRSVGARLAGFGAIVVFGIAGAVSLLAAATRLATQQSAKRHDRPVAHSVGGSDAGDLRLWRHWWGSLSSTEQARRRLLLLGFSAAVGLVPAFWVNYRALYLAGQQGAEAAAAFYLAVGVGGICGAAIFRILSVRHGVRILSAFGFAVAAVSIPLVGSRGHAVGAVGWGLGIALLNGGVTTGRKLLMSGAELARYLGRARLAFAVASVFGTGAGWLPRSDQGVLLALAPTGLLLALPGVLASPGIHPGAKQVKNASP